MKYLTWFVLLVVCSMPNLFAYDASKTEELKQHLDKVSVKFYNEEFDSHQDDLSLCKQLVLEKADPNVRSDECPRLRLSVLHTAAIIGNVELIDFFVQRGAIVDPVEQHFGQTPLVAAASFGQEEAITKLLQLGATIRQSISPFLEATKKGHINSMIRLLNAGADPYQKGGSWGQESVFDMAKGEAKTFWDTYCIELRASPKESALLVALVLNHKELIRCAFSTYLSEGTLGAAVNQADSRGRTLFDIAMIRKNELAMSILLMYGADLCSCRLSVLRFASQAPDWKTIKTIDWKTLPIADRNIQLELEKPLWSCPRKIGQSNLLKKLA